jgi:hypothetical protein
MFTSTAARASNFASTTVYLVFVLVKELLPINNTCQLLATTVPADQYTPIPINMLSNPRSLYKGF